MKVIPLVPAPPETTALRFAAPPPLSLYVHFPWCVKKCPYCDFNSHAVRDEIPLQAYTDALIADLEHALPQVWGRRVNTVFIGGGTPSLMSPEALDRLLGAVRAMLPLAPGAEITLEANPGTVEAGRFDEFRGSGITRLSLGVQSFDDRLLQAIGRIHDGAAARAALEQALRSFERVNVDLMYGLPGQLQSQALADIDAALALGPGHLSCYQLTLEPNTEFHARPPKLPDGDAAADMQLAIEAKLAGAGYDHYETSAFARPAESCRHNLNYWQFGDYLGLGAGAHGKLTRHDGIVREMRRKHPAAYLEAAAGGDFVQHARSVRIDELPFEFMMNALRLRAGVPRALFASVTGLTLAHIDAQLVRAVERGLLQASSERIVPTERGRRFLNDLLQEFLPDGPA